MIQPAQLPVRVQALLREHRAPQRLVAHLRLVHDVAIRLTDSLCERMPDLMFDCDAVLIGAATHDIGKCVARAELSQRGNAHEELGRDMLLAAGFPPHHARFAFTHGGPRREPDPTIEDLLVRTADAVWKGGRYHRSEMELVRCICSVTGKAQWEVYSVVDEILTELAEESDVRLQWQAMHPL